MSKYLSNAFSLQMVSNLDIGQLGFISVLPVHPSAIPEDDVVSVIGHHDTAAVVSAVLGRDIACNRESIELAEGDVLYVAQLTGGRLPEGATKLPDGFEIKFIKVEFTARNCGECGATDCNLCGCMHFYHYGESQKI